MTKTEDIFKTNGCPFNNRSQGIDTRIVFVCSAGMLRSPTAARIAAEYGVNARSAGSHLHYALIPLSANLIKWAHWVVFLNPENALEVKSNISDVDLWDELQSKSIVWDIEDWYNYMDDGLVRNLRANIENTFDVALSTTSRSA